MKRRATRVLPRRPFDRSSTDPRCESPSRRLEQRPDRPIPCRAQLLRSSYLFPDLSPNGHPSVLLALRFNLGWRRLPLNLIAVLECAEGLVWSDDYFIPVVKTALDFNFLIAFDPGGDRGEMPAAVLAE